MYWFLLDLYTCITKNKLRENNLLKNIWFIQSNNDWVILKKTQLKLRNFDDYIIYTGINMSLNWNIWFIHLRFRVRNHWDPHAKLVVSQFCQRTERPCDTM